MRVVLMFLAYEAGRQAELQHMVRIARSIPQ